MSKNLHTVYRRCLYLSTDYWRLRKLGSQGYQATKVVNDMATLVRRDVNDEPMDEDEDKPSHPRVPSLADVLDEALPKGDIQ
jgi:hypothetical protein